MRDLSTLTLFFVLVLAQSVAAQDPAPPSEAAPLPAEEPSAIVAEAQTRPNSEAAEQWFVRMRKATALKPLQFRFEAAHRVQVMMGMGGSDQQADSAWFRRKGQVVRHPKWGTLTTAKRSIELPGMPMAMPEQELKVVCNQGQFLCDIGAGGLAMPGQPVGLQRITVADAQKLAREFNMPMTLGMVMGDSPIYADPLDGLAELIRRTAFTLVSADDREVVLAGEAPEGLAVAGPHDGMPPGPTRIVLHLDPRSALPTSLRFGTGDQPDFQLDFSKWERPLTLDEKAFVLNPDGAAVGDLAEALRKQREAMQEMAESQGFGGDGEDYEF